MDDDDDDKDRDRVLHVIPSNQLRLIPLYCIITHIYENIIEKATNCIFSCSFNIDELIKYYGVNTKLATSGNKMYIINEIKRLFPGIKMTDINHTISYLPYNSYWTASWEEELNDEKEVECESLETDTGATNDDDDIMLNQAIQLSLKEVKPAKIAATSSNSNSSIMGQKAEERIQKSRQKYKKLYN
jgi:hypothetical protein